MRLVKTLGIVTVVGIFVAGVAPAAKAVVLPNFNTVVTTSVNNANITQWTVDGISQYVGGTGSWFYRVGAGPIINFDSLAVVGSPVQTGPPVIPFDFSPTTITTTYQDTTNGLQFTLNYQVFGGDPGSNSSTIQAQLTSQLLGTSAATNLSIFELNDLAVDNTEINDIVMPSASEPTRKMNQSDPTTLFGEGAASKLTGPGAPVAVSDPTHREAGLAATVAADVGAGLLNDTPAGGVAIGPANIAYAYQYDFTLIPGTPTQSVELDILRNLSAAPPAVASAVPEPVSSVLSLLGLAALSAVAVRRRSAWPARTHF